MIAIMLWLFVSCSHPHETEAAYHLAAHPVQEHYLEGEPIVIIVEIKNTGEEAMELGWFSSLWFGFGLYDGQGDYIDTIPSVIDPPAAMAPGHGWHTPFVELKAGQSIQTRIEILDEDPMLDRVCFRGQHVYTEPGIPDWRRFKRTLVPGKYSIRVRQLADIKGHPEKELDEEGQWVGYHEDATAKILIINVPKAEACHYVLYMDLWSSVKKKDLDKSRIYLERLRKKSKYFDSADMEMRDTICLDWGVYYFGRLCIQKEEWAEAESTLADVKAEKSFPYHLEAKYFYLLARAKQGKLRLDDKEFVQFKKETEDIILLPQLPFRAAGGKTLRRFEELEMAVKESHRTEE